MNQLFSCCSNTVSSPLYPTKLYLIHLIGLPTTIKI